MDSACQICQTTFSKKSNLRAHVKKFHPDQLTKLAPYKCYQNKATCEVCHKSFVKFSNFVQHVKKFHPDKEQDLVKRKEYTFECDKCKKHFSHLKNLKSHKNNHHQESSSSKKKSLKCSICGFIDFSKHEMHQHFKNIHDITITTKSMNFDNIDAFTIWKAQEEKATCSFFICEHGTYSTDKNKISKYVCHRSGYYKKKGKGIRHIKTQSSKKIDGFCPAEMKLTECHSSGRCLVEYTNTHAGHTMGAVGVIGIDNINLQIDDTFFTKEKEEEQKILAAISKNTPNIEKDLSSEKEKLKLELIHEIEKISTKEELSAFKKLLNPIKPTLHAIRVQQSQNLQNCIATSSKLHHNKNISQRRLRYKTKKN